MEYNRGMIRTDLHTHSAFSADGISPLADMVSAARRKNLLFYGVSEHFDFDYRFEGILAEGKEVPMTDAAAYFDAARLLQRENSDAFTLLVGAEFGYSPDRRARDACRDVIARFRPDFIVNSVHTCDGKDCYFAEYFAGKPRETAYERYLLRVKESLDAPYAYDVVGHLGYVSRNAPYEHPALHYREFPALLDDILLTVIRKEKILEVNTSVSRLDAPFLPDESILRRYRALGGEKISFASDAHGVSRIADGRTKTCRLLREMGFDCITVPTPQGERKVSL